MTPEFEVIIEDKLQALWLAEKPSREAQSIRVALSDAADRATGWLIDDVPDYVWQLVDIAAQRGLNARSERRGMTQRFPSRSARKD